jgi:CDP-diglyceride synthetase
LSLIIGFIFLKIFDLFQINDLFNYRLHFFIIIFISLISQFGDLTISFVKRLNNLKDTGNILPGHGGLLDRIDGMIFVFPILNIFINYV